MPGLAPLTPPFDPGVDALLGQMMPPGVPPIALFRTFAHNPELTAAMQPWGAHQLGRALSLSLREREILIDRTCARAGCEYEWGVHVAFFSARADLTRSQVTSLTRGGPDDACWTDATDRLLVTTADQLHDTGRVDETTWAAIDATFSPAQILDVLFLCGWYRTISLVANVCRTPLEDGAPRFADYA